MPSLVPLSVKSLSYDVISPTILPSSYALTTKGLGDDGRPVYDHIDYIPIIDVTLLISNDPKEIHELKRAGEERGSLCFLGTNRGIIGSRVQKCLSSFQAMNQRVSEGLMMKIHDACCDLFNITKDEKGVNSGKDLSDFVYYGKSAKHSNQNVLFWRDFLKIKVHPTFHSPAQLEGFRDVLEGNCEKARELAGQPLNGISESLWFQKTHIGEAMGMDRGYQLFTANLYPPCPDPENANLPTMVYLPRSCKTGSTAFKYFTTGSEFKSRESLVLCS